MIITCPSCGRKYRLEDRLVKEPFQKMRCSRCAHVFVYEHEQEQEHREGSESRVEAATGTSRKRRRTKVIASVIAAVLLVLAGSAYFYWINYLGPADRWLKVRNAEGQETVMQDGKVFLVRGLVVNKSTKSRKYVILKAKLFDDHGTAMGERFALAGLPLSFAEVREMSKEGLDKKVSDFRLSPLSTFVLYRGRELPFSIVFPDVYMGKPKEFTVEIVESPLL